MFLCDLLGKSGKTIHYIAEIKDKYELVYFCQISNFEMKELLKERKKYE